MIRAKDLKTNHLVNPVGIDVKEVYLYWKVDNCISQSAYRVVAKDEDGNLVWDSEKVESSSMTNIRYPNSLESRQRIYWKVCLWDQDDNKGEFSEETFFEIGLLEKEDWKASWIRGDYQVDKRKRYPLDSFRKVFSVEDIKKARLYITACGIYEASLNGKKIGDGVLTPGITDYNKRIYYQTYNLRDLIKKGENVLSIDLADGWYRGSVGGWGPTYQYGKETKLLAQLELTDELGNISYITSDQSWDWSNDGPIRFADNQDGEIVDANMKATYNSKALLTKHKAIPVCSNNNCMKEKEVFLPKLIISPSGKKILDFSQNIAGFIEFKINAKKGQKISLYFGEMLDKEKEFSQANIQLKKKDLITPLQKIEYVSKEGENIYKSSFCIMGFQYVLVETDLEINPKDFRAIAVYTDMASTFDFSSSNELLNDFVKATVWSAKGNSADLPTDCPTRERHGWTGDAQIFCKSASYLFDYYAFSRKFLNDVYDQQRKDGCLPAIAPKGGVSFFMLAMDGSVGWADAGIIMPYTLWKQYGDLSIIKDFYEKMKSYAIFMQKRCGKRSLFTSKKTGLKGLDLQYLSNSGRAFGEWSEPEDVYKFNFKDFGKAKPEVATAYTSYIMGLMAEMAKALDRLDDAKVFEDFSNNTKRSYQALVRREAFSLDTNRQAKLVRPLAFNLLDKDQEEFAKKRLIKALDNYGWRIGTGFLSTPLILDVLSKIDLEYAYRLLENEEMPGWLYMPKMGASTIWENWEGTQAKEPASLNHYSKGALCQWVFESMCGIKIKGENQFLITPKPGGSFTYAKGSYDSIYGKISSAWEISDNIITYEIEVPANTKAEIYLLSGQRYIQEAGLKRYMEKV